MEHGASVFAFSFAVTSREESAYAQEEFFPMPFALCPMPYAKTQINPSDNMFSKDKHVCLSKERAHLPGRRGASYNCI